MTRSVVDHLHISRRDAMASGIGAVSLAALGGGIAVPAAITTVAAPSAARAQSSTESGDLTQPNTDIVM